MPAFGFLRTGGWGLLLLQWQSHIAYLFRYIFFQTRRFWGGDFCLLRRTVVGCGFSNGFRLLRRWLLCLSLSPSLSLLIWIKTRKEKKIKKGKIREHLGCKRAGVIGIIYLIQKGLAPTFADVAILIIKVLKISVIFKLYFLEVLILKVTLLIVESNMKKLYYIIYPPRLVRAKCSCLVELIFSPRKKKWKGKTEKEKWVQNHFVATNIYLDVSVRQPSHISHRLANKQVTFWLELTHISDVTFFCWPLLSDFLRTIDDGSWLNMWFTRSIYKNSMQNFLIGL